METLFIISAYAMPLVMLAIVWLITGHFAWSALAAAVFFFVIKFSQKKLGYGKTLLMEIFVVIAIFAGDQVRVEALNDSRKKEVARQEEEARKRDLAEKESKRAEEEVLRQKKRDLVRDFALKEAPLTWEALQTLESECETVKAQVAELKKTLESFNKNAEADNDFIAARQKLRDMNQARDTLWKAMERAYIQYCKFKASAGDAELAELSRNATTAAIKEAGAAKERYRAMVQEK